MRNDMTVRAVTTTGRDALTMPESQIKVTTTSSMTKAELNPRTTRVKNRRTAQKFEAGCEVLVMLLHRLCVMTFLPFEGRLQEESRNQRQKRPIVHRP
jgi:hypothetical protein